MEKPPHVPGLSTQPERALSMTVLESSGRERAGGIEILHSERQLAWRFPGLSRQQGGNDDRDRCAIAVTDVPLRAKFKSGRPTMPSGRAGSIELHAPAELLVLVADELDNLIVG